VEVTEVLDDQASFMGIDKAFQKVAPSVQTSDVFILYLAGHGITLDSRYHFLPQDFRYYNEDSVRKNAVTESQLQKWLTLINARKSLVLLDTCNSGSFRQAQSVQRGIAEKAAIDRLTRATGRLTLTASVDDQPAMEGYKGHGCFTYTLLKALEEADKTNGNNDGVTDTLEIIGYVQNLLPKITYEKYGYEQIPQTPEIPGMPFPVGVSR
jgi:uncharacterized caspase-like protein